MYLITEVLSPRPQTRLSPWEHMAASWIRGPGDPWDTDVHGLAWALELTESGSLIFRPDDPMVCASADNDPDYYGGYGRFGGTSGATPHVAGIAALMLGSQSFKSHEEVEAAMTQNASQDNATGEIPNEAYGYGKVRGAMSTFGASIPHTLPSPIAVDIHRGNNCELMLSAIAEDGDKALANLQYDLWYNGVLDPMVNSSLELPSVETEIPVVLHAADGTGSIRRQLVLVNPAQYPCEPMAPETGGCSNQNAKNASIFPLLLLVIGLLRRRPSIHA